MTKQNKASHITEGNKMPDDSTAFNRWAEENAVQHLPEYVDFVFHFNGETLKHSEFNYPQDKIFVSDSGCPIGLEGKSKYIRKDLSIPKKEIEGLIANIEDWQVNIGRDAYADNYFNGQMEALRIILKDLQNLLGKGE